MGHDDTILKYLKENPGKSYDANYFAELLGIGQVTAQMILDILSINNPEVSPERFRLSHLFRPYDREFSYEG